MKKKPNTIKINKNLRISKFKDIKYMKWLWRNILKSLIDFIFIFYFYFFFSFVFPLYFFLFSYLSIKNIKI